MIFHTDHIPHHKQLEMALDDVEGWLGIDDARFLYQMARKTSGSIIEIGAYRGRSTISLAFGARETGSIVYSIDPHAVFDGVLGGRFGPSDRVAYYRNLLKAGLVEYAALVNLTSSQVASCWRDDIALLFVDGDHRYEAVKADIRLWSPFLISGGVIIFDDATEIGSGPYRVFQETIESGCFVQIESAGKLRAMMKN